jgi:tetratricopeptide (TPR) repeat protein
VTRRLLIAGTAAACAAAVLAFGGTARRASAPVAGDSLAQLQDAVRRSPRDVHALGLLGLAYQDRARASGDPAWYVKSDEALRRALRVAPDDLVATTGLGSLALSRHRFGEALVLGRRAVSLSPSTAAGHGVVGDALVELGRYDAAFRAFDDLARLKPGLAAYARVSYARELRGDWSGALAAMRLAGTAAIGRPEPIAWTHVQIGKLFWSRGRLGGAAHEYRAALRALPGYVYALDALAQVEAARGHVRRAIGLERQAVERVPLPQFVGLLGDLQRTAGDERGARRSYALIGAIERLLRANGVRTDLEAALFDADHGRSSLELARRAQRARPSIDGDDVLAWTLERSGRCSEALHYSQRALRLGTRDALKEFHRGMILRCLGDDAGARTWFRRSLALNPHFSVLWAPLARRWAS